MLRLLSRPATRLVERRLPDAFIVVIVLTLVAALATMLTQGTSPTALVRMWGTVSGNCCHPPCRCCWFW